jgi:tRNA-Thr(GGU) m(6)t(6)A37 methyltransferase TsaA
MSVGSSHYAVHPIGHIESVLIDRADAPKQESAGAPEAWLVIDASLVRGIADIAAGDRLVVLTWLHQADRDVLEVHPQGDPSRPLTGVFSTRSPDRPNPIGIHRVQVTGLDGNRIRVDALEAIDGTPILDLKPDLD